MLAWRCRDLTDNNPIIKGARDTIANNVVDTGIVTRPNTGFPELDVEIEKRWSEYCEAVDVARKESIGRVQRQFIEEVFSAGEVGVHKPVVRPRNGVPQHVALELIPRELMPLSAPFGLGAQGRISDGTVVRQSVELDEDNVPIAYHVLDEDPFDSGMFGLGSFGKARRISSEDMDLCFVPRRLRQLRGVPWPCAVVNTVRDEDLYSEAYLMLARAAACLGIAIEGADTDELVPQGEADSGFVDGDGRKQDALQPGMVGYLPKGAKAHVLAPNLPPPTAIDTQRMLLRKCAAGMNISYAPLARDYSQENFSATRSGQLEDRRGYRWQQLFVVNATSVPLYRRWLALEVLAGRISMTADQEAAYAKDYRRFSRLLALPPGWDWIDPQKEANATQTELAMGILSLQMACAAKGRDFREVLRQRIEAEKLERDMRAKEGLPEKPAAQPASPSLKLTDQEPEDEQTGEQQDRRRRQKEQPA